MDHFGDTKHSEDARRFNTREKAQQSIGSWLGGSSEAHGNPHSGQSFTESGFWHAHTQNPEDDLRRRDHLPIVARPISGDTATEARRDLAERLLKAREDAKAIPKYMEIISQLKKRYRK